MAMIFPLSKVDQGKLTPPNNEGRILPGHEAPLSSISFDSTGQLIASGSDDGTVKIWTNRKQLGCIRYAAGTSGTWPRASDMDLSADGRRGIMAISEDNYARVWDVQTGKELFALGPHPKPCDGVAISPDG